MSAFDHGQALDVDRNKLFHSVWESDRVGRKTLDTHLFNLRRKLRPLGLDIVFKEPDLYRLVITDSQTAE